KFDPSGNLQAVRSGAAVVEYRYEAGTSRLREIASEGAWIRMRYDSYGRIDQAQSSRGFGVRYAYDTEGNLSDVSSNSGRVTYLYDRDHQLLQVAVNDAPVFRNVYDDQGRFIRQLDAAGKVIQEQKMEETKDGGRRIVRTAGGVVAAATYDNRL